MKIALTGGSGRIGLSIAAQALRHGHSVVSIDRTPPADFKEQENLRFVLADIGEYEQLLSAFEGCDALIHMAAIPAPGRHPDHTIHNNNVVGSYNALRAAVEHGIMRICQASSVNAIGLSYSRAPRFDYFPVDEEHPNYSEEPYSLSKWICEQQADSFARRYEGIRIASLRFHWVVPDRATAAGPFGIADETIAKHLWAYTRFEAAARASLQSLDAAFEGHEVFYIVAPDTTIDVPSLELATRFFPGVPVRGDLSGYRSFFSTGKAERLLGWKHDDGHTLIG
ncbi:MAG: NAD(P)-dependent oxidoreductase [Hyphomicrobiales bacterium]|nr:NAD(P)-dependent oxidoreductase [Hyphomicrobiales bacterium]